METDVVRLKRSRIPLIAVGATAIVLGVLFVHAFALGWRAVALFPLAASFILGCALFINHLREFLLFCLMFVLPFQFGFHLIHDPLNEAVFRAGIAIDVVDVILAALYFGWMFNSVVLGRRNGPLNLGGAMGALILVWILYLVMASLLVAERLNYSLYVIIEIVKAFLLYFYLVNNLDSEQDFIIVLYGLIANTVLHAIYICFQYATGLNYTLHGELSHHYVAIEGFRPVGFTGSWDEAAILLATILAVMVAHSLVAARGFTRLIEFLLILVVSLGLLLTKMRSAWMAAAISILLVISISYFKRRIPTGLFVKVCVILMIIALIFSPFAVHRIITGTKGENRMPLMLTALNMFQENVLLGVGSGNYLVHVEKYIPQAYRSAWLSTVHNEYLLRLSETGIIGFLLYYLILFLALRKLLIGTRSTNPLHFAVSLGFLSALIGSLPNRFLSVYHFTTVFLLYSVILALASRMEALNRDG